MNILEHVKQRTDKKEGEVIVAVNKEEGTEYRKEWQANTAVKGTQKR